MIGRWALKYAKPTESSLAYIMESGLVAEQVREIVEKLSAREGALLPILHAVQQEFGHVPAVAIPVVADVLNQSIADVHGVMSFYHDFRKKPAGRHVIKICRAEACQATGAEALGEAAQQALGVAWHGTTPDGAVTLEPVFCLGLCACGPAAIVDGKLVGRLDAAKLAALIEEARA